MLSINESRNVSNIFISKRWTICIGEVTDSIKNRKLKPKDVQV